MSTVRKVAEQIVQDVRKIYALGAPNVLGASPDTQCIHDFWVDGIAEEFDVF